MPLDPALRAANPLAEDLDRILELGGDMWEALRGARLFTTGATGFVGRWMLESFLWANDALDLGAEMVALSRNPQRFSAAWPHLAREGAVTLVAGDVRTFEPPAGEFTHVLHMATETDLALAAKQPSLQFDSAVEGTRRMLDFASEAGARSFLLTSSGAVYGPAQSQLTSGVAEDATLAPRPDDLSAAYGHGKRAAEFLGCSAYAERGLAAKIARLFAFVGPYLPLDAGYAVGNFIGDALAGRTIQIAGDGTAIRSYLYAGDLAWWLWTILLSGEPARPYNVGAEDEVSVLELAQAVDQALGAGVGVHVAGNLAPGTAAHRYVPDTSRAREELGLRTVVSLDEGIRRTAAWHEAISTREG